MGRIPDNVLVIHDQYTPFAWNGFELNTFSLLQQLVGSGKMNVESRTLSNFGFDGYLPAVLLNDRIRDCQTKPVQDDDE